GGGVYWPTVVSGAGTVAMVLTVRQFNGLMRRRGARFPVPQHLVAVAVMAALVGVFRLDERYGVKIVGAVPPSLPRFEAPQVHWERVRSLSGNAFAIAILGLLEAV